jgi:hypothetical protein
MTNIPEKIFLQIGDNCPDDILFDALNYEYVTWSKHKQSYNDIPYIHEDVYKASIDAEIEILKEESKYQTIDFGRWLSKNNWHWYEELDFFYQIDYKTNKERQETGLTLYNLFCWMNDEINPFIKLENGRYCQTCGNSTTWSYDELFKMFKEQNGK